MKYAEVMARLETLADPAAVAGMARVGIKVEKTYGVSMPELRKLRTPPYCGSAGAC